MNGRIQNIINTPDTYGRTGTHLAHVIAAQTVFISEEPPLFYDFYDQKGQLINRIPIAESERDAMRQASVQQNDQAEAQAIARIRAEFALERSCADNDSLAGCAMTPEAARAIYYVTTQPEHLPVPENPPFGPDALVWIGTILAVVALVLAIFARLP